jgi:UDP-glucose 4-epimerase
MVMVVTGAAGFIGSHLTDRLLAKGHAVIGIDNFCRGTRANLAAALANEAFQLVEIDLSDLAALERALSPLLATSATRVHTVWHLAANSDIAAGVADPAIDLRDTFATTFNVLQLMRKAEIRRIAFASTSAVYGEQPGELTESAGPLLPISNYGAMKLASEAIISAAVESHLEQAWMYRFPNVIGRRGTHGVIFDLLGKLTKNAEELEVLGDGSQCKPYLHVSELIDAMLFIWRNGGDERRAIYNIGPRDAGVEVADIAAAVIRASRTNAAIRYTGGDRGWVGDVPTFSYSIEKLLRLGWRPARTSAEAVHQAVFELASERGFR